MIYRPQNHWISSKEVMTVADQVEEISELSKDKELLRNKMLSKRLSQAKLSSNIISQRYIENVVSEFRRCSTDYKKLNKLISKVSRKLAVHYAQLCRIFKEL